MRRTLAPTSSSPLSVAEPRTCGCEAEQRLGELGLPVALHPAIGEDLAAAHVEAHVVDDDLTDRVDDAEVLDDERRVVELGRVLVDGQLDARGRPSCEASSAFDASATPRRRPCRAG
jgi:hypothetical protein